MAMLANSTKSLQRTLLGNTSRSKAIVANIVTGTGADQVMRAADNIFGSPLQRVFSVQIPFLGNVGPIDVINYAVHAGGLKFSTTGIVAVAGAKFIGGTLPVLSGALAIPGLNTVANPNVTPSGPGAPL